MNNQRIKCLIVDDEPLAREILENYISDLPSLELSVSCSNAFEAIEILKKDSINLMFLDINMPKLSGISMLKSLEQKPQVIFTTAYSEYAVEGFELDAVDYLLKPFSFERFVKAVNKASDRIDKASQSVTNGNSFIAIKADKKIFKVNLDEINYIQALGDYIKIFTDSHNLVSHQTLKSLEDELPSEGFIRIHKSYIVALKSILFIEGNQVKIGDEMIPMGASYKDVLLKRFNKD